MDPEQFNNQILEIVAVSKKSVPEGDKQIYQFKYEARAQLVSLQVNLLQLLEAKNTKDLASTKKWQLGNVHLLLGCNYYETEETGSAADSLQAAKKCLEEYRMGETQEAACQVSPLVTDLSSCSGNDDHDDLLMDTYNHLGIIWCDRGEPQKAERFLLGSEKLFHHWKYCLSQSESKNLLYPPWRIEKLYINTAFFLAQVYIQLRNSVASAKYCRLTLKFQLEYYDRETELDQLDWMKNCVGLGEYYSNQKNFGQYEYCLQAAEKVLPADVDDSKRAEMHLNWGKYWLEYFRYGRQLWDQSNKSTTTTMSSSSPTPSNECTSSQNTLLTTKTTTDEEPLFTSLLQNIPSLVQPKVSNFDEARAIFKNALSNLERAAAYYVFDGFVTTYIGIQQSISESYRLLILYESDRPRKMAMLGRRAAAFEKMLGQFNVSIYVGPLRQILFELGEIYSELTDFQLQALEARNTSANRSRVNDCALKCLKHFNMFLNTFTKAFWKDTQAVQVPDLDPTAQEFQEELPEEYYHSWVIANMHCARVFNRLLADAYEDAAANLNKAVKRYLFTYEQGKKLHLDANPECIREIQLCKESSDLLPTKQKELFRMYHLV